MRERLRVDKSFDIIERKIENPVGEMTLFYIDGFIKDGELFKIIQVLIGEKEGLTADALSRKIPCAEISKASDPDKKTVYKTRYAFPYGSHTVEIDVYPFWSDRAILEVELSEENEIFKIPDSIRIIKEVSEDSRYKNTNIANCIPMDDIR